MRPPWAHTFKALVTIAAVGAVGVLGCGFLSSRGNIWERFAIASCFVMICSMAAVYGLALIYYVLLRLDLSRRFRRRSPLTDSEFIASSPALKGVDPVLVSLVRQELAKEFRSIGGERFHPDDDIYVDLHFSDIAFWGHFVYMLAANLGIDQDEFERELETVPITTVGDLILFFDRLWRRPKDTKSPSDHVQSHPVWDRALDG